MNLFSRTNLALILLGATGTTVASQPAAGDAVLIAQSKSRYEAFVPSSAYMSQQCVDAPLPAYPGLPTKRCSYTSMGTRADVTLLLPDADRLARWTITACRDAAATQMTACARHIERRVRTASGAQFPISGFVVEPHGVIGGDPNKPYCFLFRDGVTVRTEAVTSRPPQNGRCGPASAESAPISQAFRFSRVASTTRDEFIRAPGAPPASALVGLAFPNAVRAEIVASWSSDRNRLFSGSAISDKMKGLLQ